MFAEHKRNYRMIERQDVDGARATMRPHLEPARPRLMNRQAGAFRRGETRLRNIWKRIIWVNQSGRSRSSF